MNETLVKQLTTSFPNLYRTAEAGGETLPRIGFECGDGWFNIIYNLSRNLEQMINDIPVKSRKCFQVMQVKEKFGGLRFYIGSGTEAMFKLIDQAEQESLRICEICGKSGELISMQGWYMTRCEEHKGIV